jgi:hypothetical protein
VDPSLDRTEKVNYGASEEKGDGHGQSHVTAHEKLAMAAFRVPSMVAQDLAIIIGLADPPQATPPVVEKIGFVKRT